MRFDQPGVKNESVDARRKKLPPVWVVGVRVGYDLKLSCFFFALVLFYLSFALYLHSTHTSEMAILKTVSAFKEGATLNHRIADFDYS